MKKSHLKLERSVRRPQGRSRLPRKRRHTYVGTRFPIITQPSGAQRTPEREWTVTSEH